MVIPVLELRFPVASRYSKGLVRSVPMLNIFITFSAFHPPLSLVPLLSKESFTDTNQAASLSCIKMWTKISSFFFFEGFLLLIHQNKNDFCNCRRGRQRFHTETGKNVEEKKFRDVATHFLFADFLPVDSQSTLSLPDASKGHVCVCARADDFGPSPSET